jgi:hypothetical protein
MPAIRHCRHCWGNCPGDCLVPGGQGMCIHGFVPDIPLRRRLRMRLWKAWQTRFGSR